MCAGEPCESTQRSANTTTKAKRLNQVQSRRTRNKRQNQIQHSHNNGQPLRKYCMAVGSGQACISPQKTTGPLLSMRDIQLNQQLHRNRARFDLLPCFKFNSTAISTVSSLLSTSKLSTFTHKKCISMSEGDREETQLLILFCPPLTVNLTSIPQPTQCAVWDKITRVIYICRSA